ncbi:uncharacterized protein ATNIH1004_003783 [Aspergillus tanneri]|uniref:Uncharacterized protein n=1 Tax=Aspergillus tanneri TaxID=1220188 RepID=A0A5M9N0E8_9EURO|nr:uncharacterized protein ATNIH1004_003783 [Aspergillus tanneri]KAA8651090.1 hypothetical protein ATNIH1004_003783 [Aspergillus tanneri]
MEAYPDTLYVGSYLMLGIRRLTTVDIPLVCRRVSRLVYSPVKGTFNVEAISETTFDRNLARSIAFVRTSSACSVLRPGRPPNSVFGRSLRVSAQYDRRLTILASSSFPKVFKREIRRYAPGTA